LWISIARAEYCSEIQSLGKSQGVKAKDRNHCDFQALRRHCMRDHHHGVRIRQQQPWIVEQLASCVQQEQTQIPLKTPTISLSSDDHEKASLKK